MKTALRSVVEPFLAMETIHEAAQIGADVVHLSLGQPSRQPPQKVLDYVADMARKGPPGYTDARGIPALRAAIADHYRTLYGVAVDAERVFVTVGSSGAYCMALLAAFDPGDRIAIVSPYYPASPNMMKALGLEPVVMPSAAETNYQPTVDMLKALDKPVQGLVIASPSNPAGTVIDPAELQALAAYCEGQGIRIISDEIYHGVVYGGLERVASPHPNPLPKGEGSVGFAAAKNEALSLGRGLGEGTCRAVCAASILEFSDRMIVTNSFSKYYLLPGWRLGWAVMPEELTRPVETLLQNFYLSPPTLSQYAALMAMECRADFDAVVQGYARNRDILLEGLPKAGFTQFATPQGAFYLYADVSALTNDSRELCRRMLHEAHVCAVPGLDFDREQGHRFVRFSYAGSEEAMRKAVERLVAFSK